MQSNIPFEIQYLNLLKILVKKLEAQPPRQDRTGVGTASSFGHSFDIDISDMSVPLLTTKKVAYKTAIRELYWMYVLKNPDMSYLKEHNIKIWDEWAVYNEEHPQGTIGKMYGQVLGDSVQYAIDLLKERPGSRRALFSTYDKDAVALEHLSFEENVKQGRGVLNACHSTVTQLYINDDGELEMCSYQRSLDLLLGCCFNVVQYTTLAHIIAHELGTKAVRLVYHLGDAHLYANHLEAAKEQLSRPLLPCRPYIELDESIRGLSTFTPEGITLHDYQHQGAIKAQVAV